MDGHWTSDGLGLVVSDSAGQMHFYGTGNADVYARSACSGLATQLYAILKCQVSGPLRCYQCKCSLCKNISGERYLNDMMVSLLMQGAI